MSAPAARPISGAALTATLVWLWALAPPGRAEEPPCDGMAGFPRRTAGESYGVQGVEIP